MTKVGWVGLTGLVVRVSSLWVGALAVSRSAEMVTSQVKACALQSSGLGPFGVVTCQLPDIPPPWELERDAD